MQKVKKAIIPAAGMETRFLPATKAFPKEMLPIIDRPIIEYIVEEAIQSGIEDILIVTGKGNSAIEDHFDRNIELEQYLIEKGKLEVLEQVNQSSNVRIHYIRQKEPKGVGHAIWYAQKFIGDEPFAVLLGDDIVRADEPCTKQLIKQYERFDSSIVGVQEVLVEEMNRYGMIDPIELEANLYAVQNFIKKSPKHEAPSNLAIMGRYILTPEIFPILAEQRVDAGGEIQLIDALEQLNKNQAVYAYQFAGTHYDVGEKLGFILTTIAFALEREEFAPAVLNVLQQASWQLERMA